MRVLVKKAIKGGAEYAGLTGRGHVKLRVPTGGVLTVPSSPSDHRWSRNAVRDLRNAGVNI